MRALRDALSKQMQGLTFEQQHKLIKERLRTRVARRAGAK